MKTALFISSLLLLTANLFAQHHYGSGPTSLVLNSRQAVPLLGGPGGHCKVLGSFCPGSCAQVWQICEKVQPCGTVWAKVEVKGWVKVRCGGEKFLKRMMTRDHEWLVCPCPGNTPVMCTAMNGGAPVLQLQPGAVVKKCSPGLAKCGYIYASICGWVVKKCSRGYHFKEAQSYTSAPVVPSHSTYAGRYGAY